MEKTNLTEEELNEKYTLDNVYWAVFQNFKMKEHSDEEIITELKSNYRNWDNYDEKHKQEFIDEWKAHEASRWEEGMYYDWDKNIEKVDIVPIIYNKSKTKFKDLRTNKLYAVEEKGEWCSSIYYQGCEEEEHRYGSKNQTNVDLTELSDDYKKEDCEIEQTDAMVLEVSNDFEDALWEMNDGLFSSTSDVSDTALLPTSYLLSYTDWALNKDGEFDKYVKNGIIETYYDSYKERNKKIYAKTSDAVTRKELIELADKLETKERERRNNMYKASIYVEELECPYKDMLAERALHDDF